MSNPHQTLSTINPLKSSIFGTHFVQPHPQNPNADAYNQRMTQGRTVKPNMRWASIPTKGVAQAATAPSKHLSKA